MVCHTSCNPIKFTGREREVDDLRVTFNNLLARYVRERALKLKGCVSKPELGVVTPSPAIESNLVMGEKDGVVVGVGVDVAGDGENTSKMLVGKAGGEGENKPETRNVEGGNPTETPDVGEDETRADEAENVVETPIGSSGLMVEVDGSVSKNVSILKHDVDIAPMDVEITSSDFKAQPWVEDMTDFSIPSIPTKKKKRNKLTKSQ